MLTHDEMIKKMLEDPAVKSEYDALEDDFSLLDELLKARKRANMTQADVAEAMKTQAPAVARIESGGGSKKHSPSIATLRRYAEAVGCKLKITLEPI
ncbi:MAG: helix-turn-helix transcriptional regulator [Desulfobacteraceae bacterium]|nr:helix-turn-helix transcriptional regulator [Desulfobacteraceae bacterium]